MIYKVKEVSDGFLVFAEMNNDYEIPIATFHKTGGWSLATEISSAESRAREYAENQNKWLEDWEKKGKK